MSDIESEEEYRIPGQYPEKVPRPWLTHSWSCNDLVNRWLRAEWKWIERVTAGYPKVTSNMVVEVLLAAWHGMEVGERARLINRLAYSKEGGKFITLVKKGRPKGSRTLPGEAAEIERLKGLRKS